MVILLGLDAPSQWWKRLSASEATGPETLFFVHQSQQRLRYLPVQTRVRTVALSKNFFDRCETHPSSFGLSNNFVQPLYDALTHNLATLGLNTLCSKEPHPLPRVEVSHHLKITVCLLHGIEVDVERLSQFCTAKSFPLFAGTRMWPVALHKPLKTR